MVDAEHFSARAVVVSACEALRRPWARKRRTLGQCVVAARIGVRIMGFVISIENLVEHEKPTVSKRRWTEIVGLFASNMSSFHHQDCP